MRTPILIACTVLFACQCFGQETRSVIRDSTKYQEQYTVLKSDPKIKQGTYSLIAARSGKILTTGFYKNNLKDSIWREYDPKQQVIAEGIYKNGKKQGDWQYYNSKGNIINTYDFAANKLTYHTPTRQDSTFRYRVINGKDTLISKLDRAPVYLGGDMLMLRPMMYAFRYPSPALERAIVGSVTVSFLLDENGHASEYKIEKALGSGCDEEALRLVKLIPDNWVPGKLNGNNVAVIMRLPVMFDMRVKETITLPPTVVYH